MSQRCFALMSALLVMVISLAACTSATPTAAPATDEPPVATSQPLAIQVPAAEATVVAPSAESAVYLDPAAPVEARVEDLLARMTLVEKIGQMTQVEKNSIQPVDVTDYYIGSVLSGGGGYPDDNSPAGWAEMVGAYQAAALDTRLAIPLIYGVDAVHGHGNLKGAVIFPQNVGLGATRNPYLVELVGRITAVETAATGIFWNFGPVVAVPQDIRWGRTYEGFGENTELVSQLAAAYTRGLQNVDGVTDLADPSTIAATAKHFVGDGATTWGTSETYVFQQYMIDQGVMQVDEETLRAVHLPPYAAAIDAGVRMIMVSFSSWNETKMHAHHYLLTEVLKGEMKFDGFLVSDWEAIDQIPGDYASDVVTSINAGLDMIMVPYDYQTFIDTLTEAVESGEVSMERIDDAVRRILAVKFELGLFERPFPDESLLSLVGSSEHREIAREAVRQSLVLLKNEADLLPLSKDIGTILVAGRAADDIGIQCGGWTIEWQGQAGDITQGTTILEGIQAAVSPDSQVLYRPNGVFDQSAGVGIVVVGELPYAEGEGDRADLSLSAEDLAVIDRMQDRVEQLIVILVSGRPLIVTEELEQWDALVAAWLPGSEGQGVADALFGDGPFSGKLPYSWPRSMKQIPLDLDNLDLAELLFPYGFGLETAGTD